MALSSTSFSKDKPNPTAIKPGQRLNPCGRPREFDLVEWADKFYQWSLKDSALQISEFCADNDIGIDRIYAWRDKDPLFAETLMAVRAKLAARRSKLVNSTFGKLNDKDYQMYQRYYDYGLNKHHRDEQEFEYKLKKEVETAPVTIEHVDKPYRIHRHQHES